MDCYDAHDPHSLYIGFFFFSSRRRHTRLVSDWSSDVCSSDLVAEGLVVIVDFNRRTVARHEIDRRILQRSEERRVGKECRARRSPDHEKNTTTKKRQTHQSNKRERKCTEQVQTATHITTTSER